MALADHVAYAVAAYACDEASGDLLDAVNSYDGTDTNTVGAATGKIDGGRDFEADNSEYFVVGDNADLSGGDVLFQWSLWFKPESVGAMTARCLLAKGTGGGAEYYLQQQTNDTLRWICCSSAGFGGLTFVDTSSTLSAGTWHFVVVQHDPTANEIRISIDGGAFATASFSAGIVDSTADLDIGSYPAFGQHIDGVLDEIVCLRGSLFDDDDVDEAYNSGDGVAFADWAGGGAPGTYTGTGALAAEAATSAGSGAHTAPVYTATGSLATDAATSDGTGTHTAPTYTGTGTPTTDEATAAGSGTFAVPVYTASGALTTEAATSAGSGAHVATTYTGAGALATDAATSSGTGTHTAPVYTATGSPATEEAAAAGSGTFTAPVYTAAPTLATETATASGAGTFTVPTYTGAGSPSTEVATVSGTGTHTGVAGTYTGTGALVCETATCAGVGAFVSAASLVPRTVADVLAFAYVHSDDVDFVYTIGPDYLE